MEVVVSLALQQAVVLRLAVGNNARRWKDSILCSRRAGHSDPSFLKRTRKGQEREIRFKAPDLRLE
jgi:hypothetical protein